MDECYGKQIDYYNQFPNSSKVIENMVERLEKAESKNEKYKKYLFSQLENIELSNCSGSWQFDSGDGWWKDVKLSLKFDKSEQIIIDVLETFEYETRSVLYDSETQLTNIKNCSITGPYPDWDERGGPVPDGLPKFYWFTFKNEKTTYESRRRQIQYIRIPEKYNLCNKFNKFKYLLDLS